MKSKMPIPAEYRKQIERDATEMAQKIIKEQLDQMHGEVSLRCFYAVLLTLDDCFCDLFGETEEEQKKGYRRFALAFMSQIANYNRDCYEWDASKNPHEVSERMRRELEEREIEVNFE